MAEQTKGGGFRERVYFDEELWHDIEAVAAHMRLKPAELVKYLTATALAQMKGLTAMRQTQEAMKPHMEKHMVEDYERMTGQSADAPIGQGQPVARRPAPGTAMTAPGHSGGPERRELVQAANRRSFLDGL